MPGGDSAAAPSRRFKQTPSRNRMYSSSPRRSGKSGGKSSFGFSSEEEDEEADALEMMAFNESPAKPNLTSSASSNSLRKTASFRQQERKNKRAERPESDDGNDSDGSLDSVEMGEGVTHGGRRENAGKGWASQEKQKQKQKQQKRKKKIEDEEKEDEDNEDSSEEECTVKREPRRSRRSLADDSAAAPRARTPGRDPRSKRAARRSIRRNQRGNRSRSRLLNDSDDDDDQKGEADALSGSNSRSRSRPGRRGEASGSSNNNRSDDDDEPRQPLSRRTRSAANVKKEKERERERGSSRRASSRGRRRMEVSSDEEESSDDGVSARARARTRRGSATPSGGGERRFDGRRKESRARMVREDLRKESAIDSPHHGGRTSSRSFAETRSNSDGDQGGPASHLEAKKESTDDDSERRDDEDESKSGGASKAKLESKEEAEAESEDEVETADLGEVLEIKPANMKTFLTTPTKRQPGYGAVQCFIERKKIGMGGMGGTNFEYYVFIKHHRRFLMAAKKKPGNKTSNYAISMAKEKVSAKGVGYLGKVRSNFVGTEFMVYDAGENPENYKGSDEEAVRKELGAVTYASNVLGARGPRKMRVSVPQLDPETDLPIVFRPSSKSESLLAKSKDGDSQCFFLVNKPPRWNESVRAYVLNFNGRVTQASVKNFQLVHPDDHDTVILQFGRVGPDKFTMDYQYPLSPFQAFAICLSSFDYKLACE